MAAGLPDQLAAEGLVIAAVARMARSYRYFFLR